MCEHLALREDTLAMIIHYKDSKPPLDRDELLFDLSKVISIRPNCEDGRNPHDKDAGVRSVEICLGTCFQNTRLTSEEYKSLRHQFKCKYGAAKYGAAKNASCKVGG